jgi:hypothetical protein
MNAQDTVKRAELGGHEALFDYLLREGARRRNWALVDKALLARSGEMREEDVKRWVIGMVTTHAEAWYKHDVAWCADSLASEVGNPDGDLLTPCALEDALQSHVDGWTQGDGHTALVAICGSENHTIRGLAGRSMREDIRTHMTAEYGWGRRETDTRAHMAAVQAQREEEETEDSSLWDEEDEE